MLRATLVSIQLLAVLLPGRAAAQPDTLAPPHRRHHALTYDPAGQRVLLYGGQHLEGEGNAPPLDDLWSWDGARWTRLAASTGTGMLGHKIFADGAGGVFLTADAYGLTARWSGREWATVVADSATRREMAAGAWDSRRKRFVLFGGHVGGRAFPADTWELEGPAWHRVASGGPSSRLGATMAYDARRGVMVLFGGLDGAGHKFGDTWEWNGSQWIRVSSSGPSPRFGAGMAYDSKRGETILFGGVDSTNQKLNDTWRWNGTGWRRAESPAAPPVRSEGYLAYDEHRGVIVLFGGEGVQPVPTLGDTWEWDGTRWTRVR